ncbi:MAG: hypothetical protein AVDCRST_MAG40-745, partial [uncultured Gemmatimonadaceae bacterium]
HLRRPAHRDRPVVRHARGAHARGADRAARPPALSTAGQRRLREGLVRRSGRRGPAAVREPRPGEQRRADPRGRSPGARAAQAL